MMVVFVFAGMANASRLSMIPAPVAHRLFQIRDRRS
jgi:hypothetical protein